MLRSELLSRENLSTMQEMWKINFPRENLQDCCYTDGKDVFTSVVDGELSDKNLSYYLVYDDDVLIGHWGIYTVRNDPESAWLGWFGVLPAHRRQGYGTRILSLFEREARRLGFRWVRLYTDRDNYAAQNCYTEFGFTLEDFNGTADMESGPLTIGSKSICDAPVELWNDRYLEL